MALSKHHINGDVHFYFFGALCHFLPKRSNGYITYSLRNTVTVKDAIEAIGVPHVEVGLLIKEKTNIPFSYILQSGDHIYVYSPPSDPSISESSILRPPLTYPLRFILDVHLGSLARLLRLFGFDTLYETVATDAYIARIAASEKRIVLTRDIGLLKHKIIDWGYWLRSQHTGLQFQEVANRFHLWNSFAPFTLCLACNGKIHRVKKEEVVSNIPANAALYFHFFYQCDQCHRIYWQGSHYEKMLKKIERIRNLEGA